MLNLPPCDTELITLHVQKERNIHKEKKSSEDEMTVKKGEMISFFAHGHQQAAMKLQCL